MHIGIRRIIFYLFALGFVVSAVAILLYANGYRFNRDTHWFEMTGVVHIDSMPQGATISLGTATTGSFWERSVESKPLKTPARVTYVLPGRYHVTLSKDGYWDFGRDIEVEPGKTTFFSNTSLLKNDQVRYIVATSDVKQFIPTSKTTYLVVALHGIYSVDSKKTAANTLYETADDIMSATLSPDSSLLLIKTSKGWGELSMGANSHTFTALPAATGENVAVGPHNALIGCGDQGLSTLTVSDRTPVTNTPIRDCVIDDSTLYTISDDATSSESILQSRVVGNLTTTATTIAHVPLVFGTFSQVSLPYILISGQADHSFLYNTQDVQHHLVEVDGTKHISQYGTASVLANSDVEVNAYHVQTGGTTKDLVTREGNGINSVTTLDGAPYVFFVQNGTSVVALEYSDNPTPNRYTLATLDHIDAMMAMPDKKTLLIAGQRQGVNGVFELSVLE